MTENNKYAAEDFERYHSGKMSDAEMYAIEKAALQDPFLADALEGYACTGSPVKDIAELKARLSTTHKKKKTFPWLRVAAMFILMAGIGYLAYQLNFNEKDSQLSTKQVDEKNIAKQLEALKKDSSVPEKDIVINTLPQKGNRLVTKENKVTSRAVISNDEAAETNVESIPDKKLEKPGVMDAPKDLPISTEPKVSDRKEVATVIEQDKKKMDEVSKTSQANIKARSFSEKKDALQDKSPGFTINTESASQANNRAKEFNDYAQDNIKIPVAEDGKNYKGKVILSFEVNKRGNPKNIKVEQALCKPCDEEAIRLLKQGPKWKLINDKRQVVTIEF